MAQDRLWAEDPQRILENTRLIERFLDMVKIDSQSDPDCSECPSSPGQFEVARLVVEELRALGLKDAIVDESCYVYATLEGRTDGPTIGLIAHLDTAPAFSGRGVNPVLHERYDGGVIALKNDVTIDPKDNPELKRCVGDTIITSDGTTLLGADDKAGIAEILAAVEYLRDNPDIPHPTIRIGLTPDEEIGRGADRFDIKGFDALVAYTIDGGFVGDVSTETFSGDNAVVTLKGVSVHPGTAKGRMVNAMDWGALFLSRLPPDETPQETEERMGFFHPTEIHGTAAEVVVKLILRDFDDAALEERGRRLQTIVDELLREEPRLKADLKIERQYRNPATKLRDVPAAVEIAFAAIERAGLTINHQPVRGGTDGSRLTEDGLPTPNLFTGGLNYHGPQEWVSTRAMAYATCTIVNLARLWAEPPAG